MGKPCAEPRIDLAPESIGSIRKWALMFGHRACTYRTIHSWERHKIMLRDGKNRDVRAPRASHYHYGKRTPGEACESMPGNPQGVPGMVWRAVAGTALVLAHWRNSEISSARVVESGTVCLKASANN